VLDGDPPFLPTSVAVRDAAQGRRAVAAVASLGADLVKVQHKLSAEALAGIVDEARERGLGVVGHVPEAVTFAESGIGDIQHLDGLVPYPRPPETPLDYQRRWLALTSDEIDAYAAASAARGIAHTPTLAATASLLHAGGRLCLDESALQWLPRYYREGVWARAVRYWAASPPRLWRPWPPGRSAAFR